MRRVKYDAYAVIGKRCETSDSSSGSLLVASLAGVIGRSNAEPRLRSIVGFDPSSCLAETALVGYQRCCWRRLAVEYLSFKVGEKQVWGCALVIAEPCRLPSRLNVLTRPAVRIEKPE
jgi:hypothetical protein